MNRIAMWAVLAAGAAALTSCRSSLMKLGSNPMKTSGTIVKGASDTKKGLDAYYGTKKKVDTAKKAADAVETAQDLKEKAELEAGE